jgi:hypothetical protein
MSSEIEGVDKSGYLAWDLDLLASAMRLGKEDVLAYFRDGRRVSFIMERRIAYEVVGGTLSPSEGAGYDLLDKDGGKWEVRSVTKGGVYFCPSYMVGSGRHFEEDGFLAKLEDIQGYILSDVELFPDVPYWIIPTETVENWWNSNRLGTSTKISRKNALQLIEGI